MQQFVLALAMTSVAAAPVLAQEKPNIVLIMVDDLGYGDVAYHGGKAKTPHLDQLAATGARLERHYVFPMCSPTRAALLSGRYASRFGCTGATNSRVLPFATVTLATALASAGYDTALTGKWHLGSSPEWGPNRYGFMHAYGSLAGGVGPYDHLYKSGMYSKTWHRNGQLLEEEGHVTDLITQEAVRFVKAPRARPFFLYVPYTAVHVPMDEPKRWLETNAHIDNAGLRMHAACLSHLDDGVGQILQALRDRDLGEKTLVIFLSDNGAHRLSSNNEKGLYPGQFPDVRVGGTNQPLRGFKTQLYEGGIRTPALVRWPGKIKPAAIDGPLHVADWMPTLTALAGYKPTADLRWDGRDQWPTLSGQAKAEPRTLYWLGVQRRSQALVHGDWKLILAPGAAPELYDLAKDPAESTNLAERQPERLAELKKQLTEQAARDDDALATDKQ